MNDKVTYNEGDSVLCHCRMTNRWTTKKVVRATETQAVLDDGTKLKRQTWDGNSSIGCGRYPNYSYYAATEANKKRMHYDMDVLYCTHFKIAGSPTAFSHEKLAKVVAIHKKAMAEINEILKSE